MSDSHHAKMEAAALTMVVVGTLAPALQATREETVRVKPMNVYQTLVKTKELAL